MVIILKEFYTVRDNSGDLVIVNELLNEAIYVKPKHKVDLSTIEYFCYRGITMTSSSSIEEQIVLMIFKKNPDFFYYSVDNQMIEFVSNLRKMVVGLKEFQNFTKDQLVNYIKSFKKQRIVIGISKSNEVYQKLIGIGINNIIHLKDLKKNDITNQDIFVVSQVDLESVRKFEKKAIVLFDLENLTIGPVWVNDNKHEMDFYEFEENTNLYKHVPSFSKDILYSFLINCLMYLIDDCYKNLIIDVGLPFRKKFKLNYPEMRVDAFLV